MGFLLTSSNSSRIKISRQLVSWVSPYPRLALVVGRPEARLRAEGDSVKSGTGDAAWLGPGCNHSRQLHNSFNRLIRLAATASVTAASSICFSK
jgi:hypothetical protein